MKKRIQALLLALAMLVSIPAAGCAGKDGAEVSTENSSISEENSETVVKENAMFAANSGELQVLDDNYRTFYEVFLYSFYDSDGDGIGDIPGLIEKLDYINDGDDSTDTDLGMNGIWLMPIMPSTTYHKYDVKDYKDIDPEYGTLEDFKRLMEECDKRGIHVIIDLVMNHTSSQHPWFLEARQYLSGLNGAEPSEEECPYYGYYNFIQEQTNSSYCQLGDTGWYYEAPFWGEMPDLNLKNPAVQTEFEEIVDFWLDLGVDGFRLDAAKEFYSGAADSNVEVLTWFNDMVKAKKEDAYIVAEVWTDLATYAQYYASGIDSCFDFEFADKDGTIANVAKGLSGASVYGSKQEELQSTIGAYNENYIDAPFYTNHDMGRSAGYYSGEDSEAQTKIAGAMNLMMSGSAFVYYGEELGMKGAGKDENKRAPMQWSSDANAGGMCKGPSDMDAITMKFGSLEEQEEDDASVYNYYKQAVRLRNMYPAIARGTVAFEEELSDDALCVVTKTYGEETIGLFFNISAEEKTVDISSYSIGDGGELTIGGMLLTGENAVTLEGETLTLPAYSVVLLK